MNSVLSMLQNRLSKDMLFIKPGFHKANYDHDNDRFQAKTKRLM